VRPFFRDHFSLLDRQIVLVDALAAFNAGPEAVRDLEGALAGILDCFRVGQRSFLSNLVRPRIDKISVRRDQGRPHASYESRPAGSDPAAHDQARGRARAVRGRRDRHRGARRRAGDARGDGQARARQPAFDPGRAGTAGEIADGETFDGKTETAIFPGDLPVDRGFAVRRQGRISRACFGRRRRRKPISAFCASARPLLEETADGTPALPHIRLDRALQFLIGDRLK
jgi:uncharacterized protein